MDIKIESRSTNPLKYWLLAGALTAVGALALASSHNTKANLAAADIWVGEVKQGVLAQTVSGFGRLKSNNTRLISAYSGATVEEIYLKPGAVVTPESVIAKLVDPALTQSVNTAERTLIQSQNQLLQLNINQKRELLAQQSALEVLRARLESAELEVTAQSQLAEQGVVSQLEYQRRVLEHRQLTRQVQIEQERIAQLSTLHQANLAIAQSNIDAQQEALTLVKHTESKLVVKAGIAGVVQSLSVELGQSVVPGQQIALVGSKKELYALIEIPQSHMQHVDVGQSVDIDTRGGIVAGTVSRVEPVVNNGTIQVEVTLNGPLTENARPELNIAGVIHTAQIENALYIPKPISTKGYSNGVLYRLTDNGDSATATPLQFGVETKDNIQILSGADVAQRFILSDMSQWQGRETVEITQ